MVTTILGRLAILASQIYMETQILAAHLLAQSNQAILALGLVQHQQVLVHVLMELLLYVVMVSEQDLKHAMMEVPVLVTVAHQLVQLRLDILAVVVAPLLQILVPPFVEMAKRLEVRPVMMVALLQEMDAHPLAQ